MCVSVHGSAFRQRHEDSRPLMYTEGSRTHTSIFADFWRQVPTARLLGHERAVGAQELCYGLGLLVRSDVVGSGGSMA